MVNIENLIRLATLVRDETANKQNTALRVGGTFLEVVYAIRYLLETVGELDTLAKGLDNRTRFFHGSPADVDALKNKTDLGVYVATANGWTGLLSVQFDFYSTVSQVALSSSTPDYSEGSLVWKPAPCVMFRTYTDGAWSQWRKAGADVVNDLVTGGTDRALSAEQGKVLKEILDNLCLKIDKYGSSLPIIISLFKKCAFVGQDVIDEIEALETLAQDEVVEVQGITIVGESAFTDEYTYRVSFTPSNTTQRDIIWSVQSGDAEIDQNGHLVAHNAGNIVIVATSSYDSSVAASKTVIATMSNPFDHADAILPLTVDTTWQKGGYTFAKSNVAFDNGAAKFTANESQGIVFNDNLSTKTVYMEIKPIQTSAAWGYFLAMFNNSRFNQIFGTAIKIGTLQLFYTKLNGAASADITANKTLSSSQFAKIAVVFKNRTATSSTVDVWVDGIKVLENVASSANAEADGSIVIGNNWRYAKNEGLRTFNGYIKNVTLWNTILTDNQLSIITTNE